MSRRLSRAVAPLVLVVVLGGCARFGARGDSPALIDGADLDRGRQAILDAGCGACHRIPGVPGADALVGPPLDDWRRRSFIAGTLPNDPENMRAWLADPGAIRPGTAMPDLALTDAEILDISAYLFHLG